MMKVRNRLQWCGMLLLAFSLTACKVKRPDTVLPDAQMESVLYDYHIAKAMGEEVPYNESYKRILYIEAVFKKHGITQADFDTSMVWFARNPEALAKIYERVNQRLKAERDGIEHLIALRDNKPKESLPGDSIDVWIAGRIHRITGMPLDNKLTFILPADANFQERDTLRWSVRFRFDHGTPDSTHVPLMAMQIRYEKNDSVISVLRRVEGDGTEVLSLAADTLGEMKEVRGFIYYPQSEETRPLLADRISLVRYHAKDSLVTVAPNDSLQADSLDPKKEAPQKQLPAKDQLDKPKELKPLPLKEQENDAAPKAIRPRPKA